MNNKKSRWFLKGSMCFFALSVIFVIINIIVSYFEIKSDFPNDSMRALNEFGFGLFASLLIFFPVLGIELSCIRSIYKILKYDPKGVVKICYIISAILSFVAFAFQSLVLLELIDFGLKNGNQNIEFTILLITSWPVLILSFILGSLHQKSNS